ncbi:hypothetical protein FH972_007791 [Carpinus fangiana]|uniref:Pentacotripeptide-repeat region of PRORP domain-containing protein n=1 Tax=Carpinus fangiana TaxID=176857 RepID=A0A5N6R024_9ROSI|nr:hypothetical protein FH972_007791 [Carpinus fangiana]
MATLKLSRAQHSLSPPHKTFFFFSSAPVWYKYTPPPLHHQDPILSAISEAILNTKTKPLDSSLRKLLPSLTATHVINLINLNPCSLPPHSLFSFFHWLSSQHTFRHTLHSYCTMAHFLCSHNMLAQAHSLLQFVVSRKGKDSACSVFACIVETKGTHYSNFVFDALMNAYTDNGFVSDAFQCLSLVRKHKFRVPFHGCGYLLNKMVKSNSPASAWAFYREILDCGFPPNVFCFNVLMHKLCKEGKLKEARLVFDEIGKRGLRPTVVSFNTLINGYCKSRELEDGFRITYTTLIDGYCKEGDLESALKIRKGMSEEGIELDNVAFTALISGMCREGRLVDAERILREMLNAGIKPDDATYTMVMDGFCKKGDVKMGFKLLREMQAGGHVPGVITYNVLMNGLCKLGQMKNAKMLLDAMLNLHVVPDDITYNILLEGHCKHGNPKHFDKLRSEKGLVPDYASYTSLVYEFNKTSKDHQRG